MISKYPLLLCLLPLLGCQPTEGGVVVHVDGLVTGDAPTESGWLDSQDRIWQVTTASLALHSLTLMPCDEEADTSHEHEHEHEHEHKATSPTAVATTHAGHHEGSDFGEVHIGTIVDLTDLGSTFEATLQPAATALCNLKIAFDDELSITLDATGPMGEIQTILNGPATQTIELDQTITPSTNQDINLALTFELSAWLGSIETQDDVGPALTDAIDVVLTTEP